MAIGIWINDPRPSIMLIIFCSTVNWWIINIVSNLTGATTDSNGIAGAWY
jgi:hypothetical protein